jgi:hypothetical protein
MAGIYVDWEGPSYTWDNFVADFETAINILGRQGPFFSADLDVAFLVVTNYETNKINVLRHGNIQSNELDITNKRDIEYSVHETWEAIINSITNLEDDYWQIAADAVKSYAHRRPLTWESLQKRVDMLKAPQLSVRGKERKSWKLLML